MTNVIPGPLAPNPMVTVPAIYGFEPRQQAGVQPSVATIPLAAASAIVRWGDMLTLSSGQASRGSGASSTLLGFAADGSIRTENAQIPAMPFLTDMVSGVALKELRYYAAGQGNQFTAQIKFGSTLTAALVGGTACDFIPVVAAPTPVITQAGTAGATTRYYTAVPVTPTGEAIGVNGTSTTTSNATLSATNYNVLTIPYVAGAAFFNIYRGTSNSNGQLIAQVVANPSPTGTTVVNDTNLTAGGASAVVATIDNCGWVLDPATTSVGQCKIIGLVDPIGTVSGPNVPARVLFMVPSAISVLG